ncbi:MAG TPA: C25 family cysteine peptidase, partial [Candidatus Udaeobacter sp.]|nr:C25 family cysteine peptidase [Candidatus Udaeobacter sp.]
DWKTKKGVQAAVRTVEWIDQTYPNGVDRPERIRFFLRDAYQNWGTLFVLLGGDTDQVPPRYGYSTLLGGEMIPTDHYYACLEGNWNGDGDTRFGEGFSDLDDPGDAADLMPELFIGRAPVSSLAQAATFVDKTLAYDLTPAGGNGYPPSILYLAERLFDSIDGAQFAEEADLVVPPWFKRVKLYEEFGDWPGSLPETYDAVKDSVNHGFGIVHHVGHGYRNTMAIGEGVLNNPDADGFHNAPRNSVVFSINCSSASFDFNSIGERWVKNPNGGSIAYIGTSRLAFVNASRDYQAVWYASVFEDSLRSVGEALGLARLPFVPNSDEDNGYRWTVFALTLLGDPEVDLATNALAPMSVAHLPSFPLGPGVFAATVTSAGSPVPGASVTLWKAGQAYAHGVTSAGGQVTLPFAPETAGPAILTVHRSNYAVYSDTVNVVSAPGGHVFINGLTVNDDPFAPSSGDNDGLADAGETIELFLSLKNGGGAQLTGVNGVLSAIDPGGYLDITTDTVSYGAIAPGGSSAGSQAYVIEISPLAPYAYQPLLNLAIVSNQGAFTDAAVLPIRRSYLQHVSHTVDDAPPRGNGNGIAESGEQIWYRIALRNTGQESAFGVKAGLVAVKASNGLPEPLVTLADTSSSFGSIAPNATFTGDRFDFTLAGSLNPANVRLKVAYRDIYGAVSTELLDLIPPAAPDSLLAYGSPSSILLRWRRPTAADLLGYDIERATQPAGPFTKVDNYLVEGTASFENAGLPSLTRYYYRITARDSSYNASPVSQVFSGTTNPPLATGWPLEVAQ